MGTHMKETIFLHWVLKEGRDGGCLGILTLSKSLRNVGCVRRLCRNKKRYRKNPDRSKIKIFLLDFLFV